MIITNLAAAPSGGLRDMFAHPFMVQAFVAGVPIAALTGMVGYFMVLRGQVFTGDALSHVAFTGALAALAIGIDPRIGLFTATIVIAAGLGMLGGNGRPDDVVIGTVFAWVLGLGVLALSIYTSSAFATANGAGGVSVLFGSIFGLNAATSTTAAVVALGLIAVMTVVSRPLLFASVDEAVAAARGVPVRALGVGFLLVAGATAAEATPAVGALLLLGLLAAPAGAAHRLTDRPYVALALAASFSMGAMVIGLTVSYLVPKVPPSFGIISVATIIYAAALVRGSGAARLWSSLTRGTSSSDLARAG